MRKRKSPIVLITLLVVVVAGVTGFNYAASRVGGNPADAPPAPTSEEAPKAVGDPRPKESQASVSNDVNSLISAKATPATPEGKPGMPGAPGGGPMILNPASRGTGGKPEKPKPNASSTSAQWYNDESALAKDKG